MVKVTGPESATVEAPPEVDDPEKLPSELDSVHDVTLLDVQKTVVRPPSDTLGGCAQICACGTIGLL